MRHDSLRWKMHISMRWIRQGCNTLQLTTTHYSTLQYTASHWSTQQRTATHCNALPRTATHRNTLQHTATHCNTMQHTAKHCNTLQRAATHCNTLQQTILVRWNWQGNPLRLVFRKAIYLALETLNPKSLLLFRKRVHSNMSQCVAMCRSVLQYVAVCCNMLQCVAMCRSVLHYVAACCNMLQCVAMCRSVLHYVVVCCNMSQCVAICRSVLQYVAVHYNVLQWGAREYHDSFQNIQILIWWSGCRRMFLSIHFSKPPIFDFKCAAKTFSI